MESNYSTLLAGSMNFVVCAREGGLPAMLRKARQAGANTTPFILSVFLAAHFATCPPSLRSGDSRREQKTKSGSGESQGGAGIFTPLEAEGFPSGPFPPTPFPSRSAPPSSRLWRASREIRVLGSVRRLRRRFRNFSVLLQRRISLWLKKGFELRLEFATKIDFRNFGGFGFGKFSRPQLLKSPSYQLKADIPQTNPRRLFWRGVGGTELRSNSPRICGVSNFSLSAESGISQFFNRALHLRRRRDGLGDK